MAKNASRLSATPLLAGGSAIVAPAPDAPTPVAPAPEVAVDEGVATDTAVSEPITLAPEIAPSGVARLMMSDKPLGFEDMVAEQNPAPTPVPAPEPVVQMDEAPVTNEAGISLSALARTLAEQETGRAAVARRTAESIQNREITARENAKRLAEGGPARPEDL